MIRAGAAANEIFSDVRDTYTSGVAKGGTVKDRVELAIKPMIVLMDAIDAELKTAQELAAPLLAAVRAMNEEADSELLRIFDETWNDVGRPATDRYLSLLYPGGAGYYTDGDTPGLRWTPDFGPGAKFVRGACSE